MLNKKNIEEEEKIEEETNLRRKKMKKKILFTVCLACTLFRLIHPG
jgi:hypothetical protein